jgi:hypothetical protein
MTLCNRSILVVSTEPWFGPLLSKQYVAQELARQNQVLFLDPPFNLAELARRHWQRTYFRERYHNLRPANLRRFQPWRLPKDRDYQLVGMASQAFIGAQIRAPVSPRPDHLLQPGLHIFERLLARAVRVLFRGQPD